MSGLRVFVSYRRDDSRHLAGRLADHLGWEREIRSVFFDTRSIAPGERFPRRIETALLAATHTLVVIGPQWLEVPSGRTRPRLFEDDDFVRREVATALAGSGTVIPVLVDGATLPGRETLPAPLQALVDCNAYVLHNDRSFDDDLRPLLRSLIGHEPRGADTPGSIALKAGGGALGGMLAFLVFSAIVQFGLGWTAEDAFGLADADTARQLWALLPYAFTLAGALGAPVIWRRWRWPWQRRVQG